RLEERAGKRFVSAEDPLLVSVRSGAAVSMPGMMDTILNLGLNDDTTAGLGECSANPAFAADCRTRFEAMYRDIVGVDAVPADPWDQLRGAIEAVFRSWNSDRARTYRRREGIPDDLGTAVTVQAMVYGNRSADSGTGVLFTRNPATGEAVLYGDVMFDAQGEDVVAGTHETQPIAVLDERMPEVGQELREDAGRLERHHRDVCDIEFTIEHGRLWLLQCRIGKRSPQAALRVAVEMAEDPEFPLTREEAVRRVAPILADPPTTVELGADRLPLTRGLGASPGVASGEVVTSPDAAVAAAEDGHTVILVRSETSPDDVHGMERSAGILTATGGLASHAAVVARGWAIPAVVGASAVSVGPDAIAVGDRRIAVGEPITIDGSTGDVFLGAVEATRREVPQVAVLRAWARELGVAVPVKAAADDGRDGGGRGRASPPPAGTASGSAARGASWAAPSRDDVLRVLLVKGYATSDGAAAALLAPADAIVPMLDGLVAERLVESTAGSFRLTARGKTIAGQRMAEDSAAWGVDNASEALDAFLALDVRMKATVAAWQMRDLDGEQTFNDHSDPEYDGKVLADLDALHRDARGWLGAIVAAHPRLGAYLERLDRANEAAQGGDGRFVASPRVDSYHGVWFELHEDLIALGGRTRAEEVAAGRA
ncbi:MAG TPA: pyruvate, phosphate dikinase, partial [Candidatus Dormibacteraeota bacterium]|nr:pyruvate, phosphate dikinase [Candidatus Dormibacteraeota bacterium]